MNRGNFGFTLLELMIALVIVALLLCIAIPSYRAQVQKGNRAVAKVALTEIVSRQEAFFADRKAYAASLSALGYAADTVYACNDSGLTCTAGTGIYRLTFAAGATAAAFTVQASPINLQATDSCGTLSVTSIGVKSQTGSAGSSCWKS